MVILSKKEHKDILAEIERLSLDYDMQAKKIKELEYRIDILERTPRKEKAVAQVFDEWINGKQETAK